MSMNPRLYLQVDSAKLPNLCTWNYLLVFCPSQSFYDQGWIIWCHSKFYDMAFFSVTDCEWLYNIQLKTRRGVLFSPFWYLCQKLTLSPLYVNKTLLHKSSERSSLVSGPGLNSSPLEAKNPASNHSATTFQYHIHKIVGHNRCQGTFPIYFLLGVL